MSRNSAEDHNERGRVLAAEGREDEAEEAYRRATLADAGWSVPWYNLGDEHDADLHKDRPTLAAGVCASDESHCARVIAAWKEAAGYEGEVDCERVEPSG